MSISILNSSPKPHHIDADSHCWRRPDGPDTYELLEKADIDFAFLEFQVDLNPQVGVPIGLYAAEMHILDHRETALVIMPKRVTPSVLTISISKTGYRIAGYLVISKQSPSNEILGLAMDHAFESSAFPQGLDRLN